ncbi:MAG: hypothetical protein ACRCYX_13145 [Dermatophilaceae bacterium]
MPGHAFVDENKSTGLIVCVAVLDERCVGQARQAMRALVHKGSRRVHMTRESDRHRRIVLNGIRVLPVRVEIYAARPTPGWCLLDVRARCLTQIVEDTPKHGYTKLTVELDESLGKRDRQVLYDATRTTGREYLAYDLVPAAREPLLWIPDAIAWCWARGGEWKQAVKPLVAQVNIL